MLFFKCSCYLTDITEIGVLRIPPPPHSQSLRKQHSGWPAHLFYSRLKTNRRHSWFSASGLYKELVSIAQREQGLVGGSNCFIWLKKWSILYMLIQKYAFCLESVYVTNLLLYWSRYHQYFIKSFNHLFKNICLCDVNVIVIIIHLTNNNPFCLYMYLFIYKYVIIFQ